MSDLDDLYALPPEQFVVARDAAAKQARPVDRTHAATLKALRRPTVPAWLVNVLVRRRPELVEQLLALGPQLAQAQRDERGTQLRALDEQRRALLAAVADTAVELSGREVPGGVRAEVEATLEAALADPDSATAVRSGRLTRALAYAGFGSVDLADAVGAPSPHRPCTGTGSGSERSERDRRVGEAEAAALSAQGELDDAVRACARAADADRRAQDGQSTAQEAVEAAELALTRARTAQENAAEVARRTPTAVGRAEDLVARAQRRAEQARAALDALRRG